MQTNSSVWATLLNNCVTLLEMFSQAFVGVVTQRVNALEEAVSKAEKDLDPSKFRKVFFSFPKLVCLKVTCQLSIQKIKLSAVLQGKSKGSKSDVSVNWTPPKPFKASKYFTTYSPTK